MRNGALDLEELNVELWNLLTRVIVISSPWVALQLLWVFAALVYSDYLHRKDGWFKEPITSNLTFREFMISSAFLAVIATDLQLDGLLLFLKWRYIKEWWRSEKKAVTTIVLGLSTLALILVLSPSIGDWVE